MTCNAISHDIYHWWQEPPVTKRKIRSESLRQIIQRRVKSFGARNLREFVVQRLSLKQADYVRYWRIETGRQSSVLTLNLTKMCDKLEIDYAELEEADILIDRQWPVDLRRPEFKMLKSHILNEGTLNRCVVKSLYAPTGRISLSMRTQVQYYNNDPMLHAHFRQLAQSCGASSCRTAKSRIGYTTVLDGTTSRILMRLGVPPGRRIRQKVSLDTDLRRSGSLWRYHFASTLIEEGYSSLRLVRSRRLVLEVGYFRGVDVTDAVPSSIANPLPRGIRIVIGDLPAEVQEKVRANPPRLMIQEIAHLRKLHSRFISTALWPSPHPYEIRRCLRGNIIASWRFVTAQPALLKVMYSYLRIPIPSWKRKIMLESYSIYKRFRGKRISTAEWNLTKSKMSKLRERTLGE